MFIIISLKDGHFFGKKNLGAHVSNERSKLDILDNIFIGRCPEGGERKCSLHAGDVTGII